MGWGETDGMRWDGMGGWDGSGGMACDEKAWGGIGHDGVGWVILGWNGNADGNGDEKRWRCTVQRAHGMNSTEDGVCVRYRMCKPWGEGCPGVPRVLSP